VGNAIPDCAGILSVHIRLTRGESGNARTVSVVMEICELVVPLCYYAQRVFEESDYNQEAANCWKIAIRECNQLSVLCGVLVTP
jgi:hypothetical protein